MFKNVYINDFNCIYIILNYLVLQDVLSNLLHVYLNSNYSKITVKMITLTTKYFTIDIQICKIEWININI